jgi:hypothetical protein
MSEDIRPILDDWPYDPEDEVMVRKVVLPDGESRLQLRLELGVLEMHPAGRPDGQRPEGFDSLLDWQIDRARREMSEGGEERFQLSGDECRDLRREAMQYYHRRITWLRLGEFRRAAEDAEHNLAIMDLLKDRAADQEDALESEQYRALVLSHLTRARALQCLNEGNLRGAMRALDDGIETIEGLFRDDYEQPELSEQSDELIALRELRRSLRERPYAPAGIRRESDRERLQRELASAVEHEEYELAASLRDQITALPPRPMP